MNNFQPKSLEQTIKELQKKYKNIPSPLSSQYQKNNANVNIAPQQKLGSDPRNSILDGFRPQPKSW